MTLPAATRGVIAKRLVWPRRVWRITEVGRAARHPEFQIRAGPKVSPSKWFRRTGSVVPWDQWRWVFELRYLPPEHGQKAQRFRSPTARLQSHYDSSGSGPNGFVSPHFAFGGENSCAVCPNRLVPEPMFKVFGQRESGRVTALWIV